MPITKRRVIEFTPTQFSTAEDKVKFYKHFIHFMETGCKKTLFHDWFYKRLSNCFGHIAHYNSDGFYEVWFEYPTNRVRFLEQCMEWSLCGQPAYTYSDVEAELKKFIANSGIYKKLIDEANTWVESNEREVLNHLQERYRVN